MLFLQRSLVRLISFVSSLAMLPSAPLVLSASVLPAAQPFQSAPVSSASSTVVLLAHDLSDAIIVPLSDFQLRKPSPLCSAPPAVRL